MGAAEFVMSSSEAAAGLPDQERRRRLAAQFRADRNASGAEPERTTQHAANHTAGAG